MNNALLSAGASVSFGLNNTFIKNTDIVLVNIVAGAGGVDSANYQVWAAPSSGNNLAIINLQNISGGNLSEAVELNFSVIKSVIT